MVGGRKGVVRKGLGFMRSLGFIMTLVLFDEVVLGVPKLFHFPPVAVGAKQIYQE